MSLRTQIMSAAGQLLLALMLDLTVTLSLLRVGCPSALAVCGGLLAHAVVRAMMLRGSTRSAGLPLYRGAMLMLTGGVFIATLRLGIFDLVNGPYPMLAALLAAVSTSLLGALCFPSLLPWLSNKDARTDPPAKAIWIVVACVFALRAIYAVHIELLPEEAYYWNYAQHMDIGYLDHPPMVAWLIASTTALLGHSEFGVRFGAMVCSVITSFAIYRTALNTVRASEARYALLLAQLLPFLFMSGLLMTPDAPLSAAWAVAVYYLERAIVAGKARAWWAVGIAIGLGLLSKYTIALLGVATLVYLVSEPRARHWLTRIEPYGAALLALLIFSPVIYWNSQHEWASFAFQTMQRLAERPRFALPALIGGMLVVITPIGAIAAARILARRGVAADCTTHPEAGRLLKTLTWVPLAVFVLFSLRHAVKLDWTGAPWIAALPLLACTLGRTQPLTPRLQRMWPGMLATLLLVYPLLFCYLAGHFPGVGYGTHAELVPVGWRALGAQVAVLSDAELASTGHRPLVIGMDRYATASELAYYTPVRPEAVAYSSSGHLFGGMGLMYERWFRVAEQQGRSLLLISWRKEPLTQASVTGTGKELTPISEGAIRQDGRLVHPYYYRILRDYRGPLSSPQP